MLPGAEERYSVRTLLCNEVQKKLPVLFPHADLEDLSLGLVSVDSKDLKLT